MALTDRRELEFDAEALLLAVSVSSRAAQAFGLPAQMPTGVRLYPHEGRVDFLYGTAPAGQAVRLAAEPLGAVLVSYCIRARIPMPRNADKGIRIEADAVILSFRTVFARAPTPAGPDKTSGAPTPVKAWQWIEPEKVKVAVAPTAAPVTLP
jgi:hypothetical protein